MNLLKNRQVLAAWGVALLCGALSGSAARAQILYDGFDYPLAIWRETTAAWVGLLTTFKATAPGASSWTLD